MKKVLSFAVAVLLILLMCVTFSSCDEDTTVYTVGICGEGISDENDVADGFKDGLRTELGDEAVEFIVKDIKNSKSAYKSAVEEFDEKGVDLIFANGEFAVEALSVETDDIPIIGASVEDYESLLKLEDYSGVIGGNITGINSYPSASDQLDFIKVVVPEVRTVAVLYCKSDSGAKYRAEQIMERMEIEGIGCDAFVFENEEDVMTVSETAVNAANALYIISGEKTLSYSDKIREAVQSVTVPVLSDSAELCKTCCAASIYVTDVEIGVAAAKTASRILTEIADITKIHTGNATEFVRIYNEDLCTEQGIDIKIFEESDFEKISKGE